jgi:opacity protein-like surface antigen
MRMSKGVSSVYLWSLVIAAAGPAYAADVPPADDGQSPTWSGLHAGVSGSYGFGTTPTNLSFVNGGAFFREPAESPSSFNPERSGFLGGVELGYDYHIDRIVLGTQLDLSAGNVRSGAHSAGLDTLGGRTFNASETSVLDRLGTLRGQVGFLATGDLMLYGFGGLAAGQVDDGSGLDFSGAGGAHYHGSRLQTLAGWTAGAGAEYALTPGWGLKFEYLHYDLGTTSLNAYPRNFSSFHTQSDIGVGGDMARVALDYHFGDPTAPDGTDDGAFAPVLDLLGTLHYQLGTRYWYSTGTTRVGLHGDGVTGLVSRLSYTGLDTNSGELFGQVDHPSGAFVKFVLGAGSVGNGGLTDEDFPPVTEPASRTQSTQRDGGLSYATFDLGYPVVEQGGLRVAPFVGYANYHEQLNAYGCTQLGANPGICPAGSVSAGVLSITQTTDWNLLRVGLGGSWTTPWHGLKIALDGAWLPYGGLDGNDDHWLRIHTPDRAGSLAGAIVQSGIARGVQLEASATLPLTDSIDAGLGARYWYFSSQGTSLFNTSFEGPSSQETDFSSRRVGAFAQISAHF